MFDRAFRIGVDMDRDALLVSSFNFASSVLSSSGPISSPAMLVLPSWSIATSKLSLGSDVALARASAAALGATPWPLHGVPGQLLAAL